MRYIDILNILNRINICNALSKGECMHNYKFSDEITNKVMESYEKNKSTTNVDDLVNEIHKISWRTKARCWCVIP